jgi:DNA-binding NtrC family response regulator
MIDKRVRLLVTTIVRVVVREIPTQVMANFNAENPARLRFESDAQQITNEGMQRRVLVVDDESLIADSVAAILSRNGYDAEAKYSGASALDSVRGRCPDIVVSDVVMPDVNGIQLAKAIRTICPKTRVVLFSGNVDTSSLLDDASMEGYFFEILAKPVHPLQLLKTLKC